MINETNILISDLEDIRQVLTACETYFYARSLMEAQSRFGTVRESPLESELRDVKRRVENVISDYALAKYDAEREDEPEEEVEEEPEEEELPDAPLGQFKAPRQEGRRLTAEDLAEDEEGDD